MRRKFKDQKMRLTRLEIILATLLVAATLSLAWIDSASADTQRRFASPEEGFAALVGAVKTGDEKTLQDMLGPDADAVLSSGDEAADANAQRTFVAAYAANHHIASLGDSRAVLAIGSDSWEFPFPLARHAGAWSCDLTTGNDGLLNRRIGRNETAAIQACLAYVDAQREFAARTRGAVFLPYYAQRIISSRGSHDGLFWPADSEEEPQSPLGPLFA